MSKGQNRKARRAPVRKAYQQAVDAAAKEKSKQWLESHPPRVEVPVITGRWQHPDVLRQENAYEVQFGPKPEYPVIHVPLMQHHPFLRLNERANSQYDVVLMRAVEWGVTFGATIVRWWNWEPTRCDGMFNEAAVYRAARGARDDGGAGADGEGVSRRSTRRVVDEVSRGVVTHFRRTSR